MGLYRYILPMFLMILSTNMFLTKAEQTKDKEDERDEDLTIMNDAMRHSIFTYMECKMLFTLDKGVCKEFKRLTGANNANNPTAIEGVLIFCHAIHTTIMKHKCDKKMSSISEAFLEAIH